MKTGKLFEILSSSKPLFIDVIINREKEDKKVNQFPQVILVYKDDGLSSLKAVLELSQCD